MRMKTIPFSSLGLRLKLKIGIVAKTHYHQEYVLIFTPHGSSLFDKKIVRETDQSCRSWKHKLTSWLGENFFLTAGNIQVGPSTRTRVIMSYWYRGRDFAESFIFPCVSYGLYSIQVVVYGQVSCTCTVPQMMFQPASSSPESQHTVTSIEERGTPLLQYPLPLWGDQQLAEIYEPASPSNELWINR